AAPAAPQPAAPGAAAPAELPEPPAPPAPGPGAAAAPEAAVPAGSPVPPGGTAPEAAPFNPGAPAPEATGGHGHPADPDEGAGPGAPTGPEHAPDTGGTPQDGASGAAGASADPDGAGTHHTDARPDGPVPTGAPAPQDAPAAPEPGDALPQDAPRQPDAPPPAPAGDEHPHVSYVLRVNGADRPVSDAWIGESLLYVLRERLGLAGAKDGCSQGECGACNVQVDGRLVASCLVPAATAAGSEVRTVEGLAARGEPSDVQRALARCGAVQCGFCIPGMAMTLHDLLEGNHAPSDVEARRALSGNLCRCTGYQGALRAVQEVVAERRAAARAASGAGDEQPPEVRIPHQLPHPHDGGTA
ncbi:(2Fe-2S)-binding protein, partial [Streptomyces sp. CC77]|uniref:(2Fe-2S)-binding protein n=1 Tax=Streptomyces sp. CC77 TaxID=1906739 RepID=UPI0020C8C528